MSNLSLNSQKEGYSYRGQLKQQGDILTITLNYSQIDKSFLIRLHNHQKFIVYEAQLNNEILKSMDPSVLATFGSLEGMYYELVEISKLNQEQMKSAPEQSPALISLDSETGKLKTLIQISLKSGKKYRELILQTEKRKMSDFQILEHKMSNQEQIYQKSITQLTHRVTKLEKQLQSTKTKNSKLQKELATVQKKYQEDIESVQKNIVSDRQKYESQISELRQLVAQFKKNLNELQFDVNLLAKTQIKMKPKINIRGKCTVTNHIQVSKKKNCIFKYSDHLFTKKGQGWSQILMDEPIRKDQFSYFDFRVKKSRNYYICCGFGHESCLQEEDSKWNKLAITLFLLDGSIVNCGNSDSLKELEGIEKMIDQKEKEAKSESEKKKEGNAVGEKQYIRVIIDPLNRKIQWFANRKSLGTTEFNNQFHQAITQQKMYPLIICCDEGDEIDLI